VLRDDLGNRVARPATVRRVVSLVPSLTEAVASCDAGLLVGATRWCTHPPGLPVERVGGTKNPDLPRVIGLAPDLVLANEEENREADLSALRAAGVSVWVTRIRSLPEAFDSLDRMIGMACGLPRPAWLDAAEAAWAVLARGDGPLDPPPVLARGDDPLEPPRRLANDRPGVRRAIIPIWRRPWMVLGRDTFAGDLLARLGVANVYSEHAERYPKIALAELLASGADLVVLPDEPYAFTEADGPDAFPGIEVTLISGRHLTWYGPSLTRAPGVLSRQLLAPVRSA
jgi:ABC-type Fe3+-hydroxamate transport system substrate-binding protein